MLIDYKLRKCYHDVLQSHSNISIHDARVNVGNVLKLFQGASTDGNNICFKSWLRARLDQQSDKVVGAIGDHVINDSSHVLTSDPRQYYRTILIHKTNIIHGIDKSHFCLPQVFLAGLPKSGTSTIDSLLTVHPLINHGVSKEPRWWVAPQPPYSTVYRPKPSIEYLVKYMLQYSNTADSLQQDTILIDSSPNLFTGHASLSRVCDIPVVMSLVMPNPKYIVVIREPVDFLYSRFWYSCSSKVYRNMTLSVDISEGPVVFHSIISKRLNIFRNCTLYYTIERCVLEQALISDETLLPDSFRCGVAALQMAVYYIHFIKWFSVIPRENFYISTYEEFFTNPELETTKVWNFLQLPKLFIKHNKWKNKHINENKLYKKPHLKMLTKTRKMLKKFFHPFNVKLAKIIERDLKW